jgi:uncharacterized membrane protein AbrB (regulator of aidB expression)
MNMMYPFSTRTRAWATWLLAMVIFAMVVIDWVTGVDLYQARQLFWIAQATLGFSIASDVIFRGKR